uniref:Uncharacterized protein LOC111124841 n=1 Tax=Crassostrea virginica TaxID=6565 RepID=A0A8B8D6L9_CRAVI|nr:uncharacterized protein LOC111124841 [Crassostrea virginica]
MDDKFSRALTATEDTKCSLPVDISKLCSESNSEKINHTGHNPPTAESRDTKILPNENNKTKVDVHELFHESLTPTPLEIDDFYGPEVRVTNEDLCIVESFPCY